MRLTRINKDKDFYENEKIEYVVFEEKDIVKGINKLGQLEDIEDNLPAFNGLQHLFKCIDLMENYEELHFTYKGKTFVIERNE